MCPFAWRDRIFWIDTDIWPAACVDTDPTSCAQRLAFTGKQKTRVVHDALYLREHITGNEILAHIHDGVGLEAVILRRCRQRQQRGAGDDRAECVNRGVPVASPANFSMAEASLPARRGGPISHQSSQVSADDKFSRSA